LPYKLFQVQRSHFNVVHPHPCLPPAAYTQLRRCSDYPWSVLTPRTDVRGNESTPSADKVPRPLQPPPPSRLLCPHPASHSFSVTYRYISCTGSPCSACSFHVSSQAAPAQLGRDALPVVRPSACTCPHQLTDNLCSASATLKLRHLMCTVSESRPLSSLVANQN